MRRTLGLAGALVAIASLLVETLAACCMSTTFEDQVGRAKLIFVGTVTSATPARIPSRGVITRYRFDDVRYLKGNGPADSLVLAQDGGCFDGMCMVVSVGISFNVGTRYVVFADSGYWGRPTEYSSMVCGTGHPFAIRVQPGFPEPVVCAGGVSAIVAFDGRHMVVLSSEPWRKEMGAWQVGSDGQPVAPGPPPRLSLDGLIRLSDLEWETRLRGYASDPEQVEKAGKLVRYVSIYPNQDPGVRVTEEEFLQALSGVVARVCGP
jgi:hypothetical protein